VERVVKRPSPQFLEAMRAESGRAFDRAKAGLQIGDRVKVVRCGGAARTYTLTGWDERCFTSKSGAGDLSPYSIIAVNGVPTSFRDDPKTHLADPFDRNLDWSAS
jgi:hypothetical protein